MYNYIYFIAYKIYKYRNSILYTLNKDAVYTHHNHVNE